MQGLEQSGKWKMTKSVLGGLVHVIRLSGSANRLIYHVRLPSHRDWETEPALSVLMIAFQKGGPQVPARDTPGFWELHRHTSQRDRKDLQL